MRVRVKLFAIIRERAGTDQLTLDLPQGATVSSAVSVLRERFPAVADFLSRSAFAVNQSYVKAETVLNDGDELAVIPPVSGGWR